MIDTVLNLLFRCPHHRITRPITPVAKNGQPQGETYVVCLDCGKQFSYDVSEMRIGKPIDHSHDVGVLPPNMPRPRKSKLTLALMAAVPAAAMLGMALAGKKKVADQERRKPEPGGREETIDEKNER
jgi:hypothetical protein